MTPISIWNPEEGVADLAEVLYACVHAGAGVSFVLPFELDDATAFWLSKVEPAVRAGLRRVLVARIGGRIVGTVQLDLSTPPNQSHRADVNKLLVHPHARRQGIARSLMIAVEQIALQEKRTLLTLDTRTNDAAEPLYRSLGYNIVGFIPRYARNPSTPELEMASFYYKELA